MYQVVSIMHQVVSVLHQAVSIPSGVNHCRRLLECLLVLVTAPSTALDERIFTGVRDLFLLLLASQEGPSLPLPLSLTHVMCVCVCVCRCAVPIQQCCSHESSSESPHSGLGESHDISVSSRDNLQSFSLSCFRRINWHSCSPSL